VSDQDVLVCTCTSSERLMQTAQTLIWLPLGGVPEADDPAVEAVGLRRVRRPVHATGEGVGHVQVVVVGPDVVAVGVQHLHATGDRDVLLRLLVVVRAGDRGDGTAAGAVRVVGDPELRAGRGRDGPVQVRLDPVLRSTLCTAPSLMSPLVMNVVVAEAAPAVRARTAAAKPTVMTRDLFDVPLSLRQEQRAAGRIESRAHSPRRNPTTSMLVVEATCSISAARLLSGKQRNPYGTDDTVP